MGVSALNFRVIEMTRKEFRIHICINFVMTGKSGGDLKSRSDWMESKE